MNNVLNSKWTLFLGAIMLLASCGTSKSIQKVMKSYDYGVKIVHVENVNSSYDNLMSDFYEDLKSYDEKFAEKLARDTMVHMRKGACLGNCPIYRLTIYNSGRVKYEGVSNVDLVGIYESKLEEDQYKKAKTLIEAIDLPRMYSKYPRGVNMIEDGVVTKMVISDGLIKFPTAISYNQPQELTNIELYLKQLVQELSWVQI